MPYATPIKQRDGSTMTYDSGDYPECQRRALEAGGWADFPARQAAARREGRYLGLGLANYVEGTGRGPFESASLRVGASGKIVVTTGASAQGQGVKTMLAQLVGDVLGVPPDDIDVIAGDTAGTALGFGAFASRQAVTAGNAVHLAASRGARQGDQGRGRDAGGIGGRPRAEGRRGAGQGRAADAQDARRRSPMRIGGVPGFALPNGVTPGLAAAIDFPAPALTYCNGTHVCEAEVDAETGAVRLMRYVVVHDSGRIINPMIVDGQVMGAVAHGIGATLYEWMRFDARRPAADRDLRRLSAAEHRHRAARSRSITWNRRRRSIRSASRARPRAAPSPRRPPSCRRSRMRCKPFGVRIRDLPITPERLLGLIRAAK